MNLYPETIVNTYRAFDQQNPDTAVLADGSYVTTWQSNNQDGSGWGIYAQRFSALGVAVGVEFRVNAAVGSSQTTPKAAATSDGGFVITWSDDGGQDGSGYGVFGQRYSGAGAAQGNNFLVNTTTSSTQYNNAVVGYTGGFATVWASYNNAGVGNSYDIYVQRWDNAGNKVGSETLVSKTPGAAPAQPGDQVVPDIAAAANGDLVIVWQDQSSQDGSSYGVYGRRYTASTGVFSDTFLVNTTTTGAQYEPSVALLAGGGFVAVWRSDNQDGSSAGVYGQRFDAAGLKLGGEFLVNQTTNGGQYQPNVLGLSTGGFVVSFYNDNYDTSNTGSTSDVYVREYSAAGVPLSNQIKLASSTGPHESQPVLADLGNGNYVVTYTDYDGAVGTNNITQQIFGPTAGGLPRQADPVVGGFVGSVTFAENLVNATPQVIQPAVGLSDADSANFGGGQLDLFYVQYGGPEDQLGVRSVGTGPNQISVSGSNVSFEGVLIGTISGGTNGANLVITFTAAATVDAVEQLVQSLTYANTSQSPAATRSVGLRISDGDGGATVGNTMTINVTPEVDGVPALYGETIVNSYTPNDQQQPNVATLADGSYVIVWQSYDQDNNLTVNNTWGVYAQRFTAQGTAIGAEVRINSYTGSQQAGAHVAALSSGGYVVTFDDAAGVDGSGQGVIGQVYSAAGVAQGGNFVVNTNANGTQQYSDVAAYAGGGAVVAGFAAVWSDASNPGGNGWDIYLQRYTNAGVKIGAEVLVSAQAGAPGTPLSSTQIAPRVAAYANGDLVIVWRDDTGADGGASYGVFGRKYTAATNTFGNAFVVNTNVAGNQYEADVATLADGGFVVVWRDDNYDGSSAAVVGQRFNAAGAKVGAEFLVNESTSGGQYQPSVTGLSTGGFVVSFYNDNYDITGGGTSSDVYIRQYDAAGNAIDGQRKLISPSNSGESQPSIADLGGGNFVVAYTDYNNAAGGSNSNDIVQQLFGTPATLPRQADPVLGDFTGSVTFAENTINATPQVIDASVSVGDADSTNFAGGALDLYTLRGGEATDQFGVRNQGTGAGQIGVSGATVSFGGVAIGTLSGGTNGANLHIDFLAGATPAAVQALVQNLTYASTSQGPLASRTVGLRLSDGDGGSTPASTFTINVTPELDGQPVVYGEERVNTYTAAEQTGSQVAVLADGSYVVVWNSNGQDGDNYGVYGQRYTAKGVALGVEFRLNTITAGEQSYPHVAALLGAGGGGFVATWQDNSGSDGSGWGVYGQRYDASGTPVGSAFLVNSGATGNSQFHDVVVSYAGGYTVAWSSNASVSGSNGFDIYIKRYDNSGAVVTAETRVSTNPGAPGSGQDGTQYLPDISAAPNGDLVIVWRDDNSNDGSSYGIYGRTYNATAGTFSDTFLVNTSTNGAQYEPSVATLADGSFVVVWRNDSYDGSGSAVLGQRFSAAGVKLGGEFQVNETVNGSQYQPQITALSTGGFVVAFYNDNYDLTGGGTYSDVYIREYDASGNPIDGQRKLVSPGNYYDEQSGPALADLGGGNFVVTYTDYASTVDGGNNTYEIKQQIFGNATVLARQANPELGDFTGSVTYLENVVNATPQLIDAAVSLTDIDSPDFNGGKLDLYFVQGGGSADQLGVRNVGIGVGQIGLSGANVTFGGVTIGTLTGGVNGANLQVSLNANATVTAVQTLIQNLTYANTANSPDAVRTVAIRVSDGDGGASNSGTVTINVTPQVDGAALAYGESRVNTYSPSQQTDPEVTTLADGSYVVVWSSDGQDGSADGVYGQRFAANGLALGNEFRVSTASTNYQQYPHAAALSSGGFVVVWQDNNATDGASWGVMAQRYDAAGTAVGGNTIVNTTTAGDQYNGVVAGYTGGYAVVWSANQQAGGSSNDIYIRRFDNNGVEVTPETRVSTVPGQPATAQAGNQYVPDVAAYANGNLVIVWRDDNGNDGSSYGVYGRTYDAATGTFGDTFLVNTSTTGGQYEPSVATLSTGGFVVVWRNDSYDGSSSAVVGQRFDAAGVKVGGEFLVNETTGGGQYQPAVTGLSTGGFVVTFYNDNYDATGTGTYSDIYIRQYDASGNALDSQRKLVSPGNYYEEQSNPAIADLGNGSFVVTYQGYVPSSIGGNNTLEIQQQIFGSGASLLRTSANPVIGDLRAQAIYTNGVGPLSAVTAQLLDADVSVSDADSADFAGGTLIVNFLTPTTASEALGIRDQGAAAGQIGVAGATVSYGGVAIGSIQSVGGNLQVLFNSSATPAAVRALVENLTYQNTTPPSGTTNRSISVRLTDGDGGVSDASTLQITIQNSYTPPTLLLSDVSSSVALTETQAKAGALVDDAVQVDYSGATGFANGHFTVTYNSGTNRVDDQLSIRNQGTGAGQVSVVGSDVRYQGVSIGTISATDTGINGDNLDILFKAAATAQAIESVIENLVYTSTSPGPLASRSVNLNVTDGAGNSGTARTVTINVTAEADPGAAAKLFGEQQVNTFESGQQQEPAVARLQGSNNGGYVIAWTSQDGQDGSTQGVYAQRYDAKGGAVGAEFKVNTQTLNSQNQPAVAGLASGGYVIAWTDSALDGSGYGVYAQRYAADGSAQGGAFRASVSTLSNQYEPTVLGLSDGSFVVAYRSDYSNSAATYTYDVLAQRYAADGSLLGSEITLNSSGGATQFQPKLTALAGGGYVAVFTDTSGDASGYGVQAQIFTNAGAKVGALIAVNTTVAGTQQGPDITALAGGGFVASWWDNGTVYAQIFSATGASVGGQITVNTVDSPANQSGMARVAGLESGGFVVAWDGYPSASLAGSSQDVMIQQFDAAGNRVDGVKVVNTTTSSTQYLPDIEGLTGSNFVVTWAGYSQERGSANSYGVFQQLMGTAGSITQSAAPLLVDMVSSVTFDENLVNATPQVIDAGVSLTDSDSANFNGGLLTVTVIAGYGNVESAQLATQPQAQDSFSIRNQGNGATQVGVSGTAVSYGGVVVASIVSNGALGDDLVLSFNSNATAPAVEAIIENLTYANTASSPVASRTVSVTVSDGSGGASIPRQVVINVTPQADGAVALYANEQVNTYAPASQTTPDSAKLSDGGYITVWASEGQDGWSQGVYAQRFDAKGVAVGAEFRINSYTPGAQYEPTVTGLAGGGYVVAWRSDGQDGSSAGVYAQRYSNDGTAQGSEFRVNTTTGSGQYQASITATADGGFVVAWHHDYYDAAFVEYRDVYFQRYNAAGVAQGVETQMNPTGEGTVGQTQPHVMGLAGGGFVGFWTDESKDGSSYGIYAQRFDAAGAKLGASFKVNSYTPSDQSQPEAAALNDGGFIVTWTSNGQDGNSYGVFAQRYNSAGVAVGSEFRVNTEASGNQSSPHAAALSNGGWVISWYSDGQTYVQQFNASGVPVDGQLRVDTLDNNNASGISSVVGLANGGFMVTWQDYDYATGTEYNIYQQLFGNAADFTRQANPQLVDVVSSVTFLENVVNAAPQVIDPVVGLSDADSADFNGGVLEVNYLTGYALQDQLGLQGLGQQDQLGVRNQGTGVGQIGVAGNVVSYGGVTIGTITSAGANGSKLAISFNANASVAAVEQLIENLTYANTFSDPSASRTVSIRVTDGDGGASLARSVVINVTPQPDAAQALYSNETVNTYTATTQASPESAALSDGSYITVWSSTGQDGWAQGVYGQRYDAKGVAIGTEFQINSYTPYDQYNPVVTGLKGGGYVVAWRSDNQDGSSAGTYAQRYANDGTPLGAEFRVNSTTTSGQYQASISGTADGGFVVAWYHDYYDAAFVEYRDVFFQRYNAVGVPQGTETQANPTGESTVGQSQPSVLGLAGGSFVVLWTDDSKDGSSYGIYGQRFAANGTAQGSSFRVNTYTPSDQSDAHMAALNDGGFVVVWTSNGQDLNSYGVYAQRYDAAGAAVGSEFRVNNSTSGNQSSPAVATLSNGGFVVSWYADGQTIAQQFDANGARVDGELRVDTYDNNNASGASTVVGLANGGFVVSWQDYDYANGTEYNIYQQLFGAPADFVRQANPQLADVTGSVTFRENTINDVPQLIDAAVGLIDTDSSNFDGGVLEVNYLTGYGSQDQLGQQGLRAQDQLGIRNEGTGAHQVGVAGNTVSYAGVAIGTITSNGANGNKLAVTFNANATADAVEHVIESLTYANSVSNPIASRTVSIRVTDGDGGASTPQNVVINVTPENDGAVPFGAEKVVNTTVAGNQQQSSVAELGDGGYVVVWQDENGADGSSHGVYGQRYDSDDNPVGAQFRVNTTTSNAQYEAKVVGLAGGGYAVVWRSDGQDGSGAGVYGRLYAADGAAVGGEFKVNTTTSSNQYQTALTARPDGGFVVTWYHDSTTATVSDYYEVYFQRFDAAGAPQGGETRASPPISGGNQFAVQSEPSVAWLNDADGGFVVTWTDGTRDGDSNGIFAQRYTSAGVAEGPVLAVNAYISNNQRNSSVAALKDGGFVVTWESEGQDLSSTGIYAQRFDAAGAKVGTEFRVNTSISSSQYQPTVTGLENGGFAVAWSDSSPTSGDVFVQQYNALGQQVDGETRVNSYTPYVQYQPSITSMADGGFLVSYTGYIYSSDQTGNGIPDGGNDTYEIRLQRFSNTAPTVSNVSVTGQEEAVIQLTNTLFEGGFVDAEGQVLQAIKIITLPAQGLLKLGGVPVTAGLEISLAQLQAGLLTYQGNVDYFGPDQFRWNGSDGIAFATTPVFTNILLSNVNDGPRLGVLTDTAGSEGSTFSRTLVIADPDPEGHQITVAWGDGSANTVFTTSSATPNIQHVYADNGSYAVTVTVDDQQGQANSVETGSFNALIANVAPTIALFGNSSATQGTPYSLTLGSPFDPGSDTVNQYTIDWGDGSPPEVYTPATLPAGGVLTHTYTGTGTDTITVTLRDEDGTFSNAGSKQVVIQEPAEVITVQAGADAVALEGTFFSRTINFIDPTDQGASGRSYSVNWGDGQTSSGNLAAGVFAFNIGHTYADNGGPYNVLVTVDDSGAVVQQGSDTFLVSVNNVAPTVGISGAGSVSETIPYTVTLNPFDPGADTISQYLIRWGDGNEETYTAATLPANRQLTHTYADGNASFTISVDVADEDGTFAPAGSSTVFVANVAPVAPVTGANTVAEGSLYTLNVGAVTDPGPDTRTGYSIDWGDGSPSDNYTPVQWAAAQAAGGNFTHTFVDGGAGGTSRTINVIASDEDGTFTLGSKVLTVANVAPTVVLTGAANTNEAATYTLNIAASDPAGAADALGYSVDWGDGSAVQNYTAAQLAAVSGNLTHVYADDEAGTVNSTPFTIVVTVDDGDGGVTAQNKGVNVNNVAPTAPVSGAASVGEGGTYALTVGAVTDPGPDTRTGYSITWGDGSTSNFTAAQWLAAAGSFSHLYGDGPLAANIVVSATDEDGTFTLGSKAVTVGNLPPTLGLSGNADTLEGATYSLGIVGSDPAGAADPLSYTINWGDGSPAQVVTAVQLVLAGGVITHVFADDEDGPVNSTSRTISVTADDGDGGLTTQTLAVNVNNVAPTAAVGGAASVNEGSVYTLTVGAVTEPGTDARTGYSIYWGDGNTSTFTPTQWAAAAGSFTHTYADGNAGSTPTIVVSATDEDGTFTLGSQAITVLNVAPTLSLSGNASTLEGASYSLGIIGGDAAGAADPLVYSIDWNDGSAVQVLTAAQLAALGGSVAHAYTDDQDGPVNSTPRTISVTVEDGDGGQITRTLALNVDNVAPTAPVSGAASVNEGSVYTLTVGAVADPGTDTRTGYSINWGDGNTSSYTPTEWAAAAGSFTHTYADGNAGSTPTIVVSATDEDGTFTLGSRSLTVSNVAPTLTLGGNANTLEGASYTLSVAGSDPAGAADPLSYSVDWGDGSAVEFFTAAQLLALGGVVVHSYADDQDGPVNSTPRTVTVTANDGDGGITTQTKTVTVDNVAPTAALGGASSVNEGSVYTLTVGAVDEPGSDTRTGYTINWGDGTTSNFTPTDWAAAAGNFTHTYADGLLTPTIVVSTTDEDGSFTLGSKSITVNNLAPTLALSGNADTLEGASFSLGIVGGDAAGAADPLTYRIDWNDGSAVQVVTAAELAALGGSVAHVFADDEDGPVNSTPRTISVTADDGDGGLSTLTRAVNVNNVAPTLSLGGGGGAQVNQTYTLILGAVADPGQDTVSSYAINWGDGSAVQTLTAAQVAALGGNVPHTYASAGGVTIAVSLVDEDGTFANAGTLGVLVSAAVPTVGIEAGPNGALNEGSTFTRSIAFSDGADDGAAGWGYSIDYGDGTVVTGNTLMRNIDLNHVYADGDATRNVVVTVTDVPGESASDGFTVTVNNVAPIAALGGAASVNEGSLYTLTVGDVADPGQDTRTGYTINWGDGNTSNYTPTEWAAAAGNFTHTYADGLLTPTIVVSTSDEDGSFTLGSKSITVVNVAPLLGLSGNASTNEGATYSLGITGSDAAGLADPLTYTIDWNDGTPAQVVTAAQLALAGGTITHVFADDQDGPVNSTPRTVSVTANDGDGGVTTQTQSVNVNNVAPTLALAGGGTAQVAVPYTLALGAITDPGQDTVSTYEINWGDGSALQVLTAAQVAALGGDVPHTYASAGGVTIAVALVDEDGSFSNAGTQAVTVSAATPTVAIEAGPDAALDEGTLFTRSIAFTDGADNGATGWTYTINYGDGSTSSGSTLVKNIDLSHVYADGNATYNVTVTVTDDAGATVFDSRSRGPSAVGLESASDSFVVTVNNVAPTAALSGSATANEGVAYTLGVGAVADPGQDTRTSYAIAWGDGTTSNFTAAQWSAAAGSFAHTYSDGPSGATIVVSTVDEDGTFVLGSKTLTVANAAPLLGLSGNANTSEGATYSLGIIGSDPAGVSDPLSYTIDWGDGTPAQVVTAVQLVLAGGAITHVFADDQNGPVNSTPRTISVIADDGDGGLTTQTQTVNVNNVAPTIALGGTGAATVGTAYTLNLGAITDPGLDTVSSWRVDWGDGSGVQTYSGGGPVTHTYAAAGSAHIAVGLVDEDGTFNNAGEQDVTITGTTYVTVRIGDAPVRQSGLNTQWATAWSHAGISEVHKADYTNATTPWTAVQYNGVSAQLLSGGDVYAGDLGVSAQSALTSTIRQEIDGKEALRFNLDTAAHSVTLNLSNFFVNDDGGVFVEAGRLRLIDSSGQVVGETTFQASAGPGSKLVTATGSADFVAVELMAGAYNGSDFVFGAYGDGQGGFGAPITTDSAGRAHGSDYLVDWVEFSFASTSTAVEVAPLVGIPELGHYGSYINHA